MKAAPVDGSRDRKKVSSGRLAHADDAASAGVVVRVVARIEAVLANALMGVGGVHELAIAGVDPDVRDAVAVGVLEEDEVARSKILACDGRTVIVLLFSGAGKVHAVGSAKDVANERGAVEAGSRRPTEYISCAAEGVGGGDDIAGANCDILLRDLDLMSSMVLGSHSQTLFVAARPMRGGHPMRRLLLHGGACMVDIRRQLNRRGVRVLRFDVGVGRVGRDSHRRAHAIDVAGEDNRGVVPVATGDVDGGRVLGRCRYCAVRIVMVMPGMGPGAGGCDCRSRQDGGCS